MKLVDEIKSIYNEWQTRINEQLANFKNTYVNGSEIDVLAELAFCLFTPQSNAQNCWRAVESLLDKGVLLDGDQSQIQNELNGVRFHYTKAKHLVRARPLFYGDDHELAIKSKVASFGDDHIAMRQWFVDKVIGLGMKEASHFLRNIGFGSKYAILDRHILRNLLELEIITEIPETLSKKLYLEIEKLTIEFALENNIPVDALDMVFWIRAKGEIFK